MPGDGASLALAIISTMRANEQNDKRQMTGGGKDKRETPNVILALHEALIV